MTVSELANDYFVLNARRQDLDWRSNALPNDDITGKDVLMDEMATVLNDLGNVALQLTATEATNVEEMRAKATVVIDLRDFETMAGSSTALGMSLAKDVVKLTGSST
jgi:hypothetical protein